MHWLLIYLLFTNFDSQLFYCTTFTTTLFPYKRTPTGYHLQWAIDRTCRTPNIPVFNEERFRFTFAAILVS